MSNEPLTEQRCLVSAIRHNAINYPTISPKTILLHKRNNLSARRYLATGDPKPIDGALSPFSMQRQWARLGRRNARHRHMTLFFILGALTMSDAINAVMIMDRSSSIGPFLADCGSTSTALPQSVLSLPVMGVDESFNISAEEDIPRSDGFNHHAGIGCADQAMGRRHGLDGVRVRLDIESTSTTCTTVPQDAGSSSTVVSRVASGLCLYSSSSRIYGNGDGHMHTALYSIGRPAQLQTAAPSAQPGPSLESTTNLESHSQSQSRVPSPPSKSKLNDLTPAPASTAGGDEKDPEMVQNDSELKLIACCVSTCDKFIIGLRSLEDHIRDDHNVSASHNNAYRCLHADCKQEKSTRHFTKHGLRRHASKAHKIESKFNDKPKVNVTHKPSALDSEHDLKFNVIDLDSAVYLSCPWSKCNKRVKAGSFMRHILSHSGVTFQCPISNPKCRFRSCRWACYHKHFNDLHPEEVERYARTVYLERRQEDFRHNWGG